MTGTSRSKRDMAGTAAMLCAVLVAPAMLGQTAHAAGSARDYLNVPVDTWLTFSNTNYSTSVTPEDGLDVSSRVRTNVFSQTMIFTRTLDLWGRTGGISAIVPYAAIEADTGGPRFSNDGVSDLAFMFQMNLFGAPALNREQFRSFVPQTFSSFHFMVSAPTGKYDASNPVNPSSNRWAFTPTVNYSYTPDAGWTWSEMYLSARFFTRNPDFGAFGMSDLDQDPLYMIEYHLSRNVVPGLWVSLDAFYNVGGETRIDGRAQDNAANTLRLGLGAGVRVWPGGQLILNYEQVAAKPAREPDSQTFRMKVQQIW